jgi:hypothetical protein
MSAIKNFGDFWDREKIYWGSQSPGDRGHLKGYHAAKKSFVVDFRDQIAVYVLYDENMQIVYAGQTGRGEHDRLLSRLKFHRDGRARNRWRYFSWFGLRQTTEARGLHSGQSHDSRPNLATNKDALDEIEFVLLRVVEPKLNLNSGNWQSQEIERYVQWFENEDADTTFAEKSDIDQVMQRLAKIERALRD